MRRVAPLLLGAVGLACWIRVFLRSLTAPVEDADVWWVAAAGRWMQAAHAVPRTNGFSFVDTDHPWVMHEWLFALPYAWGLDHLGPRFFALVAAAAFALTSALVVAATVGRARHLGVGCLAALIPLLLFAHPTARPTWVALAFPAAVALLAFAPFMGRAAACACVALELAWTNAHGTFPIGVLLLAAGAWDASADRRRRWLVVAAAAAATLLNPYGLRLHALVLDYLLAAADRGVGALAPITEYAPLWDRRYLATTSAPAAFALATLLLLAAWSLRRRAHRARAVLVLALAPLAVAHARNAPLVALVAALALVPVVDDLVDRAGLGALAGCPWRPPRRIWGAAGAALVAAVGVTAAVLAGRAPEAWIDPALGGPAFLRLVSQLPDDARVVTPFRSAGLAIWLGAPRGVRVFYDSRNDPYSRDSRRTALTLLEQPPDVITAVLTRSGASHAVVPSPRDVEPLRRRGYDGALALAPGWSLAARDGDWALYARSAPDAR